MKLTYRHILFLIPVLGWFATGSAQNLVANPSFEDVNICTEYRAPCNPSAWVSVSPEHMRIDYLYSTAAVEGVQLLKLMYSGHRGMCNYAQSRLLCPVVAGRQYRITIVAGSETRETVEIGIRLDTTWIYRLAAVPLDTLPPTIVLTGRDALPKNKKDGIFSRMEKVFTAPAGATHIIVGSFNKPKRGDYSREYVYIDSIGLEPLETQPLCPEAQAVKDTLYASHLRHTVPRKYRIGEKTKVEIKKDKRHCVTLIVKDESIFTPKGRSKYPEAAARLDSIVRVYDPYAGAKVIVTGYALRPGTAEYNKILSTVQAQKLKDVLVYRHGFAMDDVEVYGRGNLEPRYDTATEAGKEENNFVEIEFCHPKPPPAVAPPPPPPAPDTLVIPDVLFRFNSSELNARLYSSLDSLVARIPRNDTIQLQILGYTDNVGTEAYNLSLSRMRAAAVAEYLRGKGLEKYIRHVSGLGEADPVAPNDSQEGRQRNRRVEIIIYKGLD
jgi:outer membrane protein OmpA-like peptidoglycan-associated protein